MTTAARRRSQSAPGWERRAADVPDEELQVLRTWHPNVLIGGGPGPTEAALQALRSVFRPTIVSWTAGAALQLPPDHGARTLILRDVDALSSEQQQQVLGWLQQDRGAVQVVATSARPVWPLVESGHFDASLYYALNVVCLLL